MALTITAVPDIKFVMGQSGRWQVYQLQPAANDYTTGGYVVNASAFELGWLFGVDIIGVNAAGALYSISPVFPAGSFGAVPAASQTVNLVVLTAGAQVANGTDLSTITWFVSAYGW